MSISAHALATLLRAMREVPDVVERELTAAATKATMLVEREVKENIGTGTTGLTRASVTSDVMSTPTGPLGVVGSSQMSAIALELGTRPHPQAAASGPRKAPPAEALQPWVRAVLGLGEKEAKGVAFAIAQKIKKKGTRPQRPFARALEDTTPEVDRIYEAAIARVAQHLAGGSA